MEYLNKKNANNFIPGGTTQNQFKASVVKRFGKEVELNAWVQYEGWKAPIYKPGLQKDTSAAVQPDVVSEAAQLSVAALAPSERASIGWLTDTRLEVFEGLFQAVTQIDLRLPAEKLPCPRDVGTAAGGVVLRERMEEDPGVRRR